MLSVLSFVFRIAPIFCPLIMNSLFYLIEFPFNYFELVISSMHSSQHQLLLVKIVLSSLNLQLLVLLIRFSQHAFGLFILLYLSIFFLTCFVHVHQILPT